MAVAVAGRKLGVPVEVIVPSSTPEYMRTKIQSEGAHVEVCGAAWDEANEEAKRRVASRGGRAALVHPFDHPELWDGHSTMIQEIQNQLKEHAELRAPKCIVTVAGGGGLLCGVIRGLDKVGWGNVPVVVCETKGADSLNQSIAKGEAITLPAITSVAKSLGARRVADEALKLSLSRPVLSLVVTDEQAVQACWEFLERHRVAVEPACGAGLAALYNWRALGVEEKLGKFGPRDGPVVVIACGGNMVVLEPPTKPKL